MIAGENANIEHEWSINDSTVLSNAIGSTILVKRCDAMAGKDTSNTNGLATTQRPRRTRLVQQSWSIIVMCGITRRVNLETQLSCLQAYLCPIEIIAPSLTEKRAALVSCPRDLSPAIMHKSQTYPLSFWRNFRKSKSVLFEDFENTPFSFAKNEKMVGERREQKRQIIHVADQTGRYW